MRDPIKERARKARYLRRRKIEKYGKDAADQDMRGRHSNHAHGANNARWKGGRHLTSHGYVAVRVPPNHPHAWGAHPRVKYAHEHILVAESTIGRTLADGEIVHHINGDKRDNRPENLEVMTASAHMKEHDERRGRDALGRFPPEDLRIREFPR